MYPFSPALFFRTYQDLRKKACPILKIVNRKKKKQKIVHHKVNIKLHFTLRSQWRPLKLWKGYGSNSLSRGLISYARFCEGRGVVRCDPRSGRPSIYRSEEIVGKNRNLAVVKSSNDSVDDEENSHYDAAPESMWQFVPPRWQRTGLFGTVGDSSCSSPMYQGSTIHPTPRTWLPPTTSRSFTLNWQGKDDISLMFGTSRKPWPRNLIVLR